MALFRGGTKGEGNGLGNDSSPTLKDRQDRYSINTAENAPTCLHQPPPSPHHVIPVVGARIAPNDFVETFRWNVCFVSRLLPPSRASVRRRTKGLLGEDKEFMHDKTLFYMSEGPRNK